MPRAPRLPRVGKDRAGRCPRAAAGVRLPNGGAVLAVQHPGSPKQIGDKAGRLQVILATSKLGPQARQEIVQVGRKNAADLKWNRCRVHEQRHQEHAIRQRLRGHCEKEEVRLLATLVLIGCVGHRNDEPVKEESATPKDVEIDQLNLPLACLFTIRGTGRSEALPGVEDVEM